MTQFETIELKIRDQLARTLGAGGFDPARDIAAITVNRWPHGYAYEYNSLWDKFWLEGGELPCEVARKTVWSTGHRQRRCRGLRLHRLRH
jgi:spermidine dehydrogenase